MGRRLRKVTHYGLGLVVGAVPVLSYSLLEVPLLSSVNVRFLQPKPFVRQLASSEGDRFQVGIPPLREVIESARCAS